MVWFAVRTVDIFIVNSEGKPVENVCILKLPASDHYKEDMEVYGRYTCLKYFEETGLLFRQYRKGNRVKTESMQVYRNHELLYDFDVPAGFDLFAYRPPFYYASLAPDEEREEMIVCRFKLPDLPE